MNRLNLDNTGGLPFSADILKFMQSSYEIFNALGELAGNLAILKGCVVTGTNVSDGVVYINGEVLYFKGGTRAENVIIRENVTNLIFKDGGNKPVKLQRYAEFGGVGNVFKWADFKRFHNLQELKKLIFDEENSVEKRLKKLEERVTKTIPIGLVAIWDRPADQIPEGWVEHTEMQGYTPVGQKLGDSDFGQLGKMLGAKTHTLTIAEMPSHDHEIQVPQQFRDQDRGSQQSWFSLDNIHNKKTSKAGGDKPHNNIQPSRIVRFIRFVGFDD